MSENKNMGLNDEMMAKATGGSGVPEESRYDIGCRVHLNSCSEEGVVTTIIGTVIEKKSSLEGWQYKIQDINGTTYEQWYPEIAIEE